LAYKGNSLVAGYFTVNSRNKFKSIQCYRYSCLGKEEGERRKVMGTGFF